MHSQPRPQQATQSLIMQDGHLPGPTNRGHPVFGRSVLPVCSTYGLAIVEVSLWCLDLLGVLSGLAGVETRGAVTEASADVDQVGTELTLATTAEKRGKALSPVTLSCRAGVNRVSRDCGDDAISGYDSVQIWLPIDSFRARSFRHC